MAMLFKVLFGGESGLSVAANAGSFLLRVFTGLAMAFGHGINKFPPSQGFIENTGNMGFPMPALFAWSASFAELIGGILLAIGLFTRPAAFFILSTMGVAAFVAHAADPFGKKELALLYLFVSVLFMLKGSGDWSIDKLIRKDQ